MNRSVRLSFVMGLLMLAVKCYAYFLTGSAAVLSDSAESVVHVFAVGFAVYSMWLSLKPPDDDHTYGHDRITFFSAGIEGGLIVFAALFILYHAVKKIIFGFTLENIDSGLLYISCATILNGWLGLFLIKQGKKYHSLVLEADGKHILADCVTSLGVLLALVAYRLTGWIYIDPIIAILIGCNILWTGVQLLNRAIHGLMDRVDSKLDKRIRELLDGISDRYQIGYHNLRHRNAGNRLMIEVHLLFPGEFSVVKAHELATYVEQEVVKGFETPTELITHLEPLEGHDEIHERVLGYKG